MTPLLLRLGGGSGEKCLTPTALDGGGVYCRSRGGGGVLVRDCGGEWKADERCDTAVGVAE